MKVILPKPLKACGHHQHVGTCCHCQRAMLAWHDLQLQQAVAAREGRA